ncbi:YrhK family protein [Pseudosulfitobacter koreensis]|uniref:YrhK family protein n=1 Tax=Pseudosulfitobacter koreensis TaxID=2968472 RepID=A0ABT1YW23_9RHOB|nr:YrhK family protein [Pseudosulfitobacter koreense]MCR8825065.1 YrhK family protein [Pseudosulfitobacter koreense]
MLFKPDQHTYSEADRRRFATFEIVYTLIDFAAAGLFLAGSVMFRSEAWQTPGTWLFIAGSVLFASKPTLRLIRELRLAAAGDAKDLSARFERD